MMNKSLRARDEESSSNAGYGFRALAACRDCGDKRRKSLRIRKRKPAQKKSRRRPAALKVDNREASNRVDRSHSVSKEDGSVIKPKA
jgi:hypothetical protein